MFLWGRPTRPTHLRTDQAINYSNNTRTSEREPQSITSTPAASAVQFFGRRNRWLPQIASTAPMLAVHPSHGKQALCFLDGREKLWSEHENNCFFLLVVCPLKMYDCRTRRRSPTANTVSIDILAPLPKHPPEPGSGVASCNRVV